MANNEEGKNPIVDTVEKAAAAHAQKKATQAAKKAAIALAKAAARAVQFIITALGGWIVVAVFVGVIVGVVLLANVWDYIENIADSVVGAFTSESEYYNSTEDSLGLADAVSGVFYTKYSEQSYYIMVDDDPTIYQAGSEEFEQLGQKYGVGIIEDIDNREGQFALSPTMLALLDKELNEGYLHPEQFIKPVYNSCMSNLISSEQNKNSTCTLLDLVDEEGNMVADSIYYRERESGGVKVDDVTGEVERTYDQQNHDLTSGIYDKNASATTKGVWNWGLASIIHYKKFEQDSRISDYKIQTAVIWDEESRTTKEVQGFSSDLNKDTYIDKFGFEVPNEIITYETQDEEANKNIDGLSLLVPETETKFAIDSVVTFVGNMSNSLQQSYVYQGKSGGTTLVNNYFHEYISSASDTNTSGGERRAYRNSADIVTVERKNDTDAFGTISLKEPEATGFSTAVFEPEVWDEELRKWDNPNYDPSRCVWGDPIKEVYCEEHYLHPVPVLVSPNRYNFDNGSYYIEAKEDELVFTVKYNPQLSYYKEGNLETNAVQYTNTNPDTSGIKGMDYLEDYIINYEAYLPYEENQMTTFKCYGKADSLIEEDVDASLYTFNLDDPSVDVQLVSSCNNGSFVAKSTEDGLMEQFYFDEMPLLQIAKIANELGLELNNIEDGEIDIIEPYDIDVTLKNVTDATKISEQKRIAETYNNSKYQKYFDEFATKYGIDANLLAAIAVQESGGNHDEYIGSNRNYEGFGLMGIEAPGNSREIRAYNFATREEDVLTINVENMKNVSKNIQAAAMELQSLLVKYKYNALLAIQAYEYGEDGIAEVLKLYEEQTGIPADETVRNASDYGWTLYTKHVYQGDFDYVTDILIKLPSKILTFQSASEDASKHSIKRVNFGEVYNVAEENWSSAAINKTKVKSIYRRVKEKLPRIWSLLTINQKDYYAGAYTNRYANSYTTKNVSTLSFKSEIQKNISNKSTDTAFRVFGRLENEIDRNNFIQKIFAYENGDNYHDYDVFDDKFWISKYSSLFNSVGSKGWVSNVDINALFGGFITIPVETYKVQKEFGWQENEFGYRELNTVTEYITSSYAEVKLPYEGVVTDVSNKETTDFGKYIEILHSGDSDNATITRYLYLGEILVESGQALKAGDTIAKTKESGLLGVQLIVNGTYNDFGEVIRVVEDYYKAEYLLYTSSGSSGPQNEAVTAYLEALLEVADEVESLMTPATGWALSSLTDTSNGGRKSAGTWRYPNSSSDDHPGLDWATPKGTEIYAFGDVVILNLLDNCQDYPNGTSYNSPQNSSLLACNGKYGNKLVVVFKHENGNIYTMTILHAQYQSMAGVLPNYTPGDASSFLVENGTTVAKSGHTGISTGPHEHIELINFGSGVSLKDIITMYINGNYNSHFGIGYVPAYQSRCENNTGARPCKERPDQIFAY